MIGIYSICEAKPWYDYDVYTSPADGDHFLINDISETGPPDNNAEGTLKRLAWLYVQPRDSDLTAIAALTTATYGRALLAVATELAFQQLVNLEIGVDVQAYHINLDAIADAEAGVADPGITMYDNNDGATGTSFIYGQSVDGTKAIVMSIGVEEETTGNAAYIELDGINKTVDVLKPLTVAGSIDASIKYSTKSVSYNIETTESSVCRKAYSAFGHTTTVVFTLPDESVCGSGDAKEFYFADLVNTAGYDMTIDVNGGTDEIFLNGVSCTDGKAVLCTSDTGNSVHVIGASETYWMVVSYLGTCVCET